ncbi:MAG TPA: 16S rRNA (uracil(1498)-N(3))-methyltransferase [Christensenellaceae bacterium]|jgi:16S rRNA (uracil1498-N3)-methyltransferase|nr:16S rRNA (uracil(1498)-N(3))-methyltransferase [Christensenellaceae bacterium]
MHSFFVDEIRQGKAYLSKDDFHHAKRVLRLKDGEEVNIIHAGVRYIAKYSISKAHAEIIDTLPSNEASAKITLYQAILKGDRMDYVFQKCTEIGVVEFFPCVMKRCVARDADNKLKRWQRIAKEAACQSVRSIVPKVNMPITTEEMADRLLRHELAIIPWENAEGRGLRDVYMGEKDIAIVIGPEGGITEEEIDMLGVNTVTLGKRILRSETAGLVAATGILLLSGNME